METYLHRAVALYKLKDLDGALTGVKEACLRAFFKVTIRDHKNRFATVFTSKVSRDTQGTVRRPGVGSSPLAVVGVVDSDRPVGQMLPSRDIENPLASQRGM